MKIILILLVVFLVGCCPCREYHYYYLEKQSEYPKWYPYFPDYDPMPIPLPLPDSIDKIYDFRLSDTVRIIDL